MGGAPEPGPLLPNDGGRSLSDGDDDMNALCGADNGFVSTDSDPPAQVPLGTERVRF